MPTFCRNEPDCWDMTVVAYIRPEKNEFSPLETKYFLTCKGDNMKW